MNLLPCPFCGKPPFVFECNVLQHPQEPGAAYNLEYSAKCAECGVEIVEEYKDELAKRWNTRAALDDAVVVPSEPTTKMFGAFISATLAIDHTDLPAGAFEAFCVDYRAMIAAAPSVTRHDGKEGAA